MLEITEQRFANCLILSLGFLFYLRSIILTENKIESEVGNLKAFSP
jgi:hypothetical protein